VIVDQVGETTRVVQMSMGQEHVLDLELLVELEGGCDRPRLEEHRTVEQETGKVPLRHGPALTAEHPELHGGNHSRGRRQGALKTGSGRIK
jgi:hypothetical protein